MKNNELLKKVCRYLNPYPSNLCLSLRPNPTEVQTEISTLDPKSQAQFMDLVVEYMEETMNWPEPDNQETFEKQIIGIMP